MRGTSLQAVSVTVRPGDATGDDGLEALRTAVAEATGVDVVAIRTGRACPRCGRDDHGKPWATVAGRPVGVSVARTPGVVVRAVGPGAVGVDVERPSRVGRAPVDVSTVGERARGHDPAVLWAVKEAVLKRDGRGLRMDPRDLDVTVEGDAVSSGGVVSPVGVVSRVGVLATVDWPDGAPVRVVVYRPGADLVVAVATDPGVDAVLSGG